MALAYSLPAAEEPPARDWGTNLYWPGDFELGFPGGCFSFVRRGEISAEVNRTPGGRASWQLSPGYQHLELLVPAHRRGRLSFWALSAAPQKIDLLVVAPLEGVADDASGKKSRTISHPVDIKASDAWQFHEVPFETEKPYPHPPRTEILVTCFNGSPQPFYIDDLQVHMEADTAPVRGVEPVPCPLRNADFLDGTAFWQTDRPAPDRPPDGPPGLWLGVGEDSGTPASMAWQPLEAKGLAGRRIRISADVTYVSMQPPYEPWGAILFVLHQGDSPQADVLPPLGHWPFWCPIGHAARPGEARRISAEYQIPATADRLVLCIQAQQGIGRNRAVVRGIAFEDLGP